MAKDDKVILTCEVCLSRNYTTHRSKNKTKRLELKKYCPRCGKATLHKETK
ncbi:MAG: 50S ribosomal protein L33 [Erysipelotrichaceae bacterium]|nr:50S ribosomal protein L33 [Erysipelotrichaceae bacterium]